MNLSLSRVSAAGGDRSGKITGGEGPVGCAGSGGLWQAWGHVLLEVSIFDE